MAKVPSLPHRLTPTVGPSPPSSLKKYDLFQWILCSCSSPLSTPWPIIYLKPCLLQVTLLADPVGPVKMLHSYCSQLHPSSHMNFSLGTSVGFPGGSVVKKKKKNLPASAGDTGSIPAPGGSRMLSPEPLHLSLCSRAQESQHWSSRLRAWAPQEKPLQWEAHTCS